MNRLFKDKVIEAKIRKNKNDDNFDKNYKKVVKELEKQNIKIEKRDMIDGKLFRNINGKKKRKGTPGTILKRINRKDKDIKLELGFFE